MSVNIGIGLGVDVIDSTYDDWFLPSKNELNGMYIELHLNTLGNFAIGDYYWSSSEQSSTGAWDQIFSTGTQGSGGKASIYHVRACRFFTTTTVYSKQDIGQAGGYIFEVVDNGNGTYSYYEAAPSDQTDKEWSNIVNVGLTTTSVAWGEGENNTGEIITQEGHTDSAAKLCNDLVL